MKDLAFEFFSKNSVEKLSYNIRLTPTGWLLSHNIFIGECDPDGGPYLYAAFNYDRVDYPYNFGESLEWLWEQIGNGHIDIEQLQLRLQELADWLTQYGKTLPPWDYKQEVSDRVWEQPVKGNAMAL